MRPRRWSVLEKQTHKQGGGVMRPTLKCAVCGETRKACWFGIFNDVIHCHDRPPCVARARTMRLVAMALGKEDPMKPGVKNLAALALAGRGPVGEDDKRLVWVHDHQAASAPGLTSPQAFQDGLTIASVGGARSLAENEGTPAHPDHL
ncbi:MAG: hypothetical protein JWQ04_655 [Pedosphaera sp.]|nr:hypothetical protein [Pedosphaera sp.]